MIRTLFRYCPDTVSKFVTASYFKIGSFLSNGVQEFHSSPESVQLSSMKVRILPALKDNYMYLIIDERTREAAAVDPVEPRKMLTAVNEENAKLTTVLTTHHHWDHAGGNKELLKLCPGLEVVGGDERIDGLTRMVSHNDRVNIGTLTVQCLFTPCHTKGHICYYIPQDNEPSVVFTGDTLFTAGCGKFFEGTASQMYAALIKILSQLPESTKVFSGHEYTVNNLNFAKTIDPDNQFIKEQLESALRQREMGKPTVPSSIGVEKKMNPFMRVCDDDMQRITGISDPVSVMGFLRQKKDEFKGLCLHPSTLYLGNFHNEALGHVKS